MYMPWWPPPWLVPGHKIASARGHGKAGVSHAAAVDRCKPRSLLCNLRPLAPPWGWGRRIWGRARGTTAPTPNPYCYSQSERGATGRVILDTAPLGAVGRIIGQPAWDPLPAGPQPVPNCPSTRSDVVLNSRVPSPIFLSFPVLA